MLHLINIDEIKYEILYIYKISFLRILYMLWSYSPLYQLFPYPWSFPSHPTLCSFFHPHQSQCILYKLSYVCGLPLEHSRLTIGYIIEKQISLSQQLRFASSFSSTCGISCPTNLSTLRFGLAWICTDLMHVVILPEFIWGYSLLFPEDTISLYLSTAACTFSSFCLYQWFLSMLTFFCLLLCAYWPIWMSTLIIFCKKTFSDEVERYLNLWV